MNEMDLLLLWVFDGDEKEHLCGQEEEDRKKELNQLTSTNPDKMWPPGK